ncbi:MAG: inorganic diphosphatase, partial [Oscillospiraceae bacterium]
GYNSYKELTDLPAHVFDEMGHFFSVYKALEGKETVAGDVNDRKSAVEVIEKAMEHYIDCYCK